MSIRVHVSACLEDELGRIVRWELFTECTECFLKHYRERLPPFSPRPAELSSVQYDQFTREAANEASSQVAVDREMTNRHGQQNQVSGFDRYFHQFFEAKKAAILGALQRAWDIEWALSDKQVSEKKLGWEKLCEPVQTFLAAQAEEDKKAKVLFFVDVDGDPHLEMHPTPRCVYPNVEELVPEEGIMVLDKGKAGVSDKKGAAATSDQLMPHPTYVPEISSGHHHTMALTEDEVAAMGFQLQASGKISGNGGPASSKSDHTGLTAKLEGTKMASSFKNLRSDFLDQTILE
ncbi:hypothetical protein CB0940_04469 [Cercospora beticola]|uniref:Uncharacterized protein n=1 Tax=Cercospora beticola TaxID=122368 RepID=A0A2G5HLQ6_CERBT|nr:hypothetical protein CB0940_04469 [Cercospora beticola]PIA93455.1 hypothetical protein CB0940_04469 [Cercospora beticola]WPB01713.1 hypothetical protein RHO25_006343 [Cercospora beticola]CAK1363471.1 unnamed protein product [Cercospora beticola]